MKRLALSACALLLLAGSAAAKSGTAASTVNLRADANTTSEILAKIPAGSRLDLGDCKDGWCAVTFDGKSGFAIQTAVGSGPRRTVRRLAPGPGGAIVDDDDAPVVRGAAPPGYVRVPGPTVYAPGPAVVYAPGPYYYGGPYYGGGPYWGGYYGPRWGYGWRRW